MWVQGWSTASVRPPHDAKRPAKRSIVHCTTTRISLEISSIDVWKVELLR